MGYGGAGRVAFRTLMHFRASEIAPPKGDFYQIAPACINRWLVCPILAHAQNRPIRALVGGRFVATSQKKGGKAQNENPGNRFPGFCFCER